MNISSRTIALIASALIGLMCGAYSILHTPTPSSMSHDTATPTTTAAQSPVTITPIEHASMHLVWHGAREDSSIYVDPVGTDEQYASLLSASPADIILVTDIHGDHFNSTRLEALITTSRASGTSVTLIVPEAVHALLSPSLLELAAAKSHPRLFIETLVNGDSFSLRGISVDALPMYNLPETADSKHTKGRGNGYLLSDASHRIYIAGDTAGIPEMRALRNIDTAFIPMNLPYTMSVDEAADAVLAFAPKIVYPYHYRGPDGLSDVAHFKQLVESGNPDIHVELAKWY